MMSLNKHTILGVTAAIFTATAVFAGGHNASPEQKAVNARQAHMGLYSFNLGILGGMAKGDVEYNADVAMAAASDLAALATMTQANYWMPGTSSDDMESSRALPNGWTDYEDAIEKSKGLAMAAVAMKDAAGTLEGVRGAIGAVGGACGACHKVYRKPNS